MLIEKRTSIFQKWIERLPLSVKEIVLIYIERVKRGNFSNCESKRSGVSAIKIYYQKGYRIYYTMTGNNTIIILLAGGTKGGHGKGQDTDIQRAIEIREALKAKGEI